MDLWQQALGTVDFLRHKYKGLGSFYISVNKPRKILFSFSLSFRDAKDRLSQHFLGVKERWSVH